jgi:hypothetical protein
MPLDSGGDVPLRILFGAAALPGQPWLFGAPDKSPSHTPALTH